MFVCFVRVTCFCCYWLLDWLLSQFSMGEHFVPRAAACYCAAIALSLALYFGEHFVPHSPGHAMFVCFVRVACFCCYWLLGWLLSQFSMGEHFVPLAAASYCAAIALSLALYFGEHFVPHGPGSFLWRNILFPKDAAYCAFVHLYVGNR